MRAKDAIIALAVLMGIVACGGGGEQAATEVAAESAEAKGGPEAAATIAAPGAAGAVIQSQETNVGGLVAELTEATREDGVLTVKVRIRNTGTTHVNHNFDTHGGSYPDFYVTAADQKYFLLKDSEGAPLAPVYLDVSLDPGQTSSWWAKFPAPPATETAFDLVMIDVTPFEDVPITDE